MFVYFGVAAMGCCMDLLGLSGAQLDLWARSNFDAVFNFRIVVNARFASRD